MKKLFTFLLTLTMVITVGIMSLGEENKEIISASAETYEDFVYTTLSDGTLEITSYTGTAEDLQIPNIILGKKVTSINTQMEQHGKLMRSPFYTCTSISIPSNIVYIANEAFHGSPADIIVDKANKYFASKDGVLYNKDYTMLVHIPKTKKYINIPDTVRSHVPKAFQWCDLIELDIPRYFTKIDKSEFYNCESLKSVTIPDSVISIGDSAFDGCSSLTSVTIPNSVTSIGDYAFISCSNITSITLGNNVTTIGSGAFKHTNIQSIVLPNSVTSIGYEAFYTCSMLSNVTAGNNITKIESYAFNETPFYNNQETDVKYLNNWVIGCNKDSAEIKLKESSIGIASSAFNGCTKIANITIPKNIKFIEKDYRTGAAFLRCTSLKSISVDPYNENYSSQNGVLFNKDKTKLIQYPVGNMISSYTIPNSVKNIDKGAFYKCTGLTSTTIPSSVTIIGDRAFNYCENLKEVYYGGTKDDWSKINIGSNNNELTNANIHYHMHSYTNKITKQPTCTATGVRTYKCSCGDSYTETIAKKAHTYSSSWTIDKVATCTSTGSKSHHCTVCGAKKDVTSIPKTVHNYNNGVVTKQPTCTSTGIRTYTCTVCGGTKTETIPATGHKFGSWTITKKATCKATGIQTRKCSLCGKTETKTIAKTAHSYKNINVNSTYFAKGYTGKKCSKCGTITGKKYKALLTMSSPKASSVSTTSLKLTWSKVKDAKGYEVYQNGKKIKTVSGTNYTVSKLKAGTTFTFTVKPYNSKKAYGNQSKVLKVTTIKLGKISLNWKKTSGANGYQVQICPNNKFKSGVKSYTTTRTNLAISGLPKGKSYYVRLRAYKKSGSKYKYSVWSKIKKAVSR